MPAASIPPKDALQRLLDGLQMFVRSTSRSRARR